MNKIILFMPCFFSAIYVSGQENKWQPVNLDEVLSISLPIGYIKNDTTIKEKTVVVYSTIFTANTIHYSFYISIDSANIPLNIYDRRSALISLEGIGNGVCIQYSEAGYKCESSDTSISKIPVKKLLIYESKTDLALFGYVLRANNKTYKLFSTINSNGVRPSDLNKLLASVKFKTENISEYKFYSQ